MGPQFFYNYVNDKYILYQMAGMYSSSNYLDPMKDLVGEYFDVLSSN